MSSDPQPVHFYVPSGMTFAERILCRAPDRGVNTHVTEYGAQVTCKACDAILRERERALHEHDTGDPWVDP